MNDRIPAYIINEEKEARERKRFIEEKIFSRDRSKTFESFDRSFNSQAQDVGEIMDFLTDKTGKTLFLRGNVGLGKSHLAQACANDLDRRGVQVVIISAYRLYLLFREIASFDSDELYEKAMNRIWEASVLIIDDLGTENQTESQVFNRNFQELLDEFRGKFIITTNFTQKEIEATYGMKIASRLCEDAIVITLSGKDYRKDRRRT
jgi:DNA replication protein DnaC